MTIQKNIVKWYDAYGRHDLPWRQTTDIYHVAVAEVMLQQTNVPKVVEKYKAFIKKFPTIVHLAKAAQREVVMQWQGLGYNRRAIYLHNMAKKITEDFNGVFPENPDILISLAGIGPYTSRSIPIFARNSDYAACDVNIARILRRIHKKKNASDRKVFEWAEQFLYQKHARDWHNALMDFASLVCTKRAAQCVACPIKKFCSSFPNPDDEKKMVRKEVGRVERGKHVPRRIFRGRIVEFLRTKNGSVDDIGRAIKKDWHSKEDYEWCKKVLEGLEKDRIVVCADNIWMLH